MFGNSFTADDQIIRSLEIQGFRRLYRQNYDHKRELKKLNHSILANFLYIFLPIIFSISFGCSKEPSQLRRFFSVPTTHNI